MVVGDTHCILFNSIKLDWYNLHLSLASASLCLLLPRVGISLQDAASNATLCRLKIVQLYEATRPCNACAMHAYHCGILVQITREELVQQLRNQGKAGQSKTSRFHGVMKHQKGKWEARLGQSCGSKYQYLGLFATEIDAAVAFDRASIAQRGLEGITNFGYENYKDLLGAVTVFH
jgi:hypothetical protein